MKELRQLLDKMKLPTNSFTLDSVNMHRPTRSIAPNQISTKRMSTIPRRLFKV